MSSAEETIAAIATAAGGALGVIRISGPRALEIAARHFDGLPDKPRSRHLYHGWWRDAAGQRLDEGLLVCMPGPRSYTGEDVVELTLHGGALGLRRCLEVCWPAGARPAEPGEFTRRAFLNGRMDLTRAEAVADLIAARTDRALAQARSHLQGALYRKVEAIRQAVLQLRARIEVNIDFVEEDVPPIALAELTEAARAHADKLRRLAGTSRRGRLQREGARVVLAGPPNAGKSSLFNALCRDERAIVTPVPGTTRDALAECLDIDGIPVVLVDTAGVHETRDQVERVGVERARAHIEQADLVIWLHGGDGADESIEPAAGPPVVRITSKVDLPTTAVVPGSLPASALTGQGLDELCREIVRRLCDEHFDPTALVIGRQRQLLALEAAATALDAAAAGLEAGAPPELTAVDVQEASDALGELVGLSTIEDVLDELFAEFCIGK